MKLINYLFGWLINRGRNVKLPPPAPLPNSTIQAIQRIDKEKMRIRKDEAEAQSLKDASYLNQLLNIFFGSWSDNENENVVAFNKLDMEWRKYTYQINQKYSKRLGKIPPDRFRLEVLRNIHKDIKFQTPKLPI